MDVEGVLAIVGIFFVGPMVMFLGWSKSGREIGHAIADAIRGSRGVATADPQLREDVEQLRVEMDELRTHLAEAHERLDFAERLLAKKPDAKPELSP